MFGIGTGELLLILVIAMVFVGPERMVKLAGEVGRLLVKLRDQTQAVTKEFKEAFDLELQGDLSELSDLDALIRGDSGKKAPARKAPSGGDARADAPQPQQQGGAAVAPVSSAALLPSSAVAEAESDKERAAAHASASLAAAGLAYSLIDGEIEVLPDDGAADADREAVPEPNAEEGPVAVGVGDYVDTDAFEDAVMVNEVALVAELDGDEAEAPVADGEVEVPAQDGKAETPTEAEVPDASGKTEMPADDGAGDEAETPAADSKPAEAVLVPDRDGEVTDGDQR